MDEKVLAVLTKDPRMGEVRTLRDVPEHVLREISCFFEQYKVFSAFDALNTAIMDRWTRRLTILTNRLAQLPPRPARPGAGAREVGQVRRLARDR